jgi:SAM-dependent methyltransferase
MSNAYNDLESLGLVSKTTVETFSESTRDCKDLQVWRDRVSGVIFISDFYVGDSTYSLDTHLKQNFDKVVRSSLEDDLDCNRRLKDFRKFYDNKIVCEIGYGDGNFMKGAAPHAKEIRGIELNNTSLSKARDCGFVVEDDLSKFAENYFDTVILFHTFEHFPDPLQKLNLIMKHLKKNGKLIIEVPHAGDLLLRDEVACDAFKAHTLWSQHLILHTRNSLAAMLKYCGFININIQGVQRYPLSNHLQWLSHGRPGGHMSNLSAIDNDSLFSCYEASLGRLDATDTITAVATAR